MTDVAARGKAMLTCFANDLVVFSHNQLYGRWYVEPAGGRPKTGRSLRFMVENEAWAALLYSASSIEVLRRGELASHAFLASLGPDALDPEVEPAFIEERLAMPGFAKRQLGALLLDQRFVAGVGNYLRSDILFDAGLHPARRSTSLTGDERARLAAAIVRITRRAYRAAGVTNDPRRATALRRSGMRRPAFRHLVFAREAQPCWSCARLIERIDVAGRRLYLCVACQPEG